MSQPAPIRALRALAASSTSVSASPAARCNTRWVLSMIWIMPLVCSQRVLPGHRVRIPQHAWTVIRAVQFNQ